MILDKHRGFVLDYIIVDNVFIIKFEYGALYIVRRFYYRDLEEREAKHRL